MTPEQLINTAARHQVMLEQLKSGYVRDFDKVWAELNDAIAELLNGLEVNQLDEISRTDLNAVIAQLTEAQNEIWDQHIDGFIGELPQLSEQVAQFERKAIQSVMRKKDRGRVKLPKAQKAHAEALRRPVQATGEKLEPLIKEWQARAIKHVNTAVVVGYEQGQTVPEILRRLKGTATLRYKDGVTELNKRQLKTVVRTSVQHVAHTAREVTYEENSDLVQGVEWVSTLDSKTTIQCQSLDGKKFKLGKGPRPPIHPNCRSTTAPDLVDDFDFLDAGATRSSKDGPVDADLSYYDWLKDQPQSFQDMVLGETRGKLFRDGGLSATEFANLQLDKNFEPINLDEMRKREPLAFERAGLD